MWAVGGWTVTPEERHEHEWGVGSRLMTLESWIWRPQCPSFEGLCRWGAFLDHLCASEGIHFTPETKVVVFINSWSLPSWLILIPFDPWCLVLLCTSSLCLSPAITWAGPIGLHKPLFHPFPLSFSSFSSLSSSFSSFFVSLQPLCFLFPVCICIFGSSCKAAVLHLLLNQWNSASGAEFYSLFFSSNKHHKSSEESTSLFFVFFHFLWIWTAVAFQK